MSTSSQVGLVEELAALIESEGYEAGDQLPPIRKLSQVLRAGRNAVRDGLLEAQALGLVKIEPRQGVFVQGSNPGRQTEKTYQALEKALGREEQNLFHLVDARLVIESELAAEAARSRRPEDLLPLRQSLEKLLAAGDDRAAYVEADEAFHLTLARIAGNRVLRTFLEVLWRLIRPAKSQFLLSSHNRRLSDREHQELFQCIVAGDAAGARSKMDAHIRQGRGLLSDFACTVPTTSAAPRAAPKNGNGGQKTPARKQNKRR